MFVNMYLSFNRKNLSGGKGFTTMAAMKLRDLLAAKAGVQSSGELGRRLGLTRQHAHRLWSGRDPIGLRLMRQIKEAYGISLDELAEVDEAVPGRPRARNHQPTPVS
jgi:transcriptional regulator with XRE-family HTH domain